MKKIISVAIMVFAFGFIGCTREWESTINNFTYTNPKKSGGTYTIIQNGTEINHLKCVYWATEDDDSVFEAPNGKLVFVNGSSVVIQE